MTSRACRRNKRIRKFETRMIAAKQFLSAVLDLGGPPIGDKQRLSQWLSTFRSIKKRYGDFKASDLTGEAYQQALGPPRVVEKIKPVDRIVKEYGGKRRCECCYVEDNLTKHHYVPVAVGGGKGDVVVLCRDCHRAAHMLWGPGDNYQGPDNARDTLLQLNDFVRQANKGDTKAAWILESQRVRDERKSRHRICAFRDAARRLCEFCANDHLTDLEWNGQYYDHVYPSGCFRCEASELHEMIEAEGKMHVNQR